MIERTFIEQGLRHVELDKFLRSKLGRAGFTKSEIVKTPLVTRIVVNVVSPGLAIGKGGENIRMLTEAIKTKYGIENPQLEIKEITKPNLDAQAVCDRIVAAVERGFSWRSVAFRTLRDIMSAGALGTEIMVKGVIAGKGQRKRKQRLAAGYMKKVGFEATLVDSAKGTAVTKIGAIGFKVRIVHPDVQFLDKVDLKLLLKGPKTPVVVETTATDAEAAEPVVADKEAQPAQAEEKKETDAHKPATGVAEKKAPRAKEAKKPSDAKHAEKKPVESGSAKTTEVTNDEA
ncbi:MAG: 30S ribosomal protein S3 [Candidatus Diapherotrites archaeon]|nr:30S ribosomal protein S3 [Candidatus Diapherotrites archaeon]